MELEKRLVAAVEGGESVTEKILAIFSIFVDHCLNHREYFRLTQYFLSESVRENLPQEMRETIDSHSRDLLELAGRVVRHLTNEKEFEAAAKSSRTSKRIIRYLNEFDAVKLAVLGLDLP